MTSSTWSGRWWRHMPSENLRCLLFSSRWKNQRWSELFSKRKWRKKIFSFTKKWNEWKIFWSSYFVSIEIHFQLTIIILFSSFSIYLYSTTICCLNDCENSSKLTKILSPIRADFILLPVDDYFYYRLNEKQCLWEDSNKVTEQWLQRKQFD